MINFLSEQVNQLISNNNLFSVLLNNIFSLFYEIIQRAALSNKIFQDKVNKFIHITHLFLLS